MGGVVGGEGEKTSQANGELSVEPHDGLDLRIMTSGQDHDLS